MCEQDDRSAVRSYLNLMAAQRESMFSHLEGLTPQQLWQRPAPKAWSIGEILNHTVLVIRSMYPFVAAAWCLRWTSALMKNKPFKTEIEDPYRKPYYPHWEGVVWTPKYSARNPVPLATLEGDICQFHQKVQDFYEPKCETELGHVYFILPIFGVFNLIQALRIGIFHDQLHYEDVIKQRRAFHLKFTPASPKDHP